MFNWMNIFRSKVYHSSDWRVVKSSAIQLRASGRAQLFVTLSHRRNYKLKVVKTEGSSLEDALHKMHLRVPATVTYDISRYQ